MRRHLALLFAVAALAACGDDGDETTPCEAVCDKGAALACANDGPKSECVSECNAVAALVPAACRDEFDALITCYANGAWACVDGYAEPQASCDAEMTALETCAGGASASAPFGLH
jgi:hypothetical protein